jgi:pimeloyl-ACP methyl ester carboxylesterase
MRLSAITWPFPFWVRLGWATAGARNPHPTEALGRAFLLRGNGAVFSRGFGPLCGALRRAGLWAEDLRCVGDLWLCRHLAHEHKAARLLCPVVFVGHSRGGRSALYAARQLEQLGVVVDLLVCVDVAWPYEVAGNVRRAVHLYRGRRRLYPARPLRAAAGSQAVVENVDLDEPSAPVSGRGLHHLNITACQAVRDYVIGRVLQALIAATPGEPRTPWKEGAPDLGQP